MDKRDLMDYLPSLIYGRAHGVPHVERSQAYMLTWNLAFTA
jgi:hypothetical protein